MSNGILTHKILSSEQYERRSNEILEQMQVTLCESSDSAPLINQDRSQFVFQYTILSKFMGLFAGKLVSDVVSMEGLTNEQMFDPDIDIDIPKPDDFPTEEEYLQARIAERAQVIQQSYDEGAELIRQRIAARVRIHGLNPPAGRRRNQAAADPLENLPADEQVKFTDMLLELEAKRNREMNAINSNGSDWQSTTRYQYEAKKTGRKREQTEWKEAVKTALTIIQENCSFGILNVIRDQIENHKPRKAVAKIIEYFSQDDLVRHNEQEAANHVWTNYIYINETSMDNNITYFEKILERYKLAYQTEVSDHNKKYRFLEAIRVSKCHSEIRRYAEANYDQLLLHRSVEWSNMKTDLKKAYHALLATGKISRPVPLAEITIKPRSKRQDQTPPNNNKRKFERANNVTSNTNKKPWRPPRYGCMWCNDKEHYARNCPSFKCSNGSTKCNAQELCSGCKTLLTGKLEKVKGGKTDGKSNSVMDNGSGRKLLFSRKPKSD